ncbi:MAG: hybrid sensor histidine kinase/response regulator [Acidiferrobacteraceae bacterium]
MAAAGKIDPSTLSWVKTEIDETLKRARSALESFIENAADGTRLRFCITYIHQVVGTLQMVELDAPALLASEIEFLAEAVAGGKVPADASVFDLLTRSILSLPEYLARLQFGQPDAPLRLAPLVNDLRKARGNEQAAETDLFAPDLDVFPPGSAGTLPAAEYQDLLKKQRAGFQAALVSWLRQGDPAGPERLATILDPLRDAASNAFQRQFFWVASAFLEALSGGLEAVAARKKLAGRIEQQIKKFIDDPQATSAPAVETLVKALLFELAHAQGRGPRTTEVRDAFHLDALLGVAQNDDSPIENLPPPEIIQSLSVALTREMETAEDLFTTYLDPEHKDAKSLRPLGELMAKTGRTLDMLGLMPMKALAEEIVATLNAVEDQRLGLSDALSMRIAASLLQLQNSARDLQSGGMVKHLLDEHINSLRSLRGEAEMPGTEGFEISDAVLSDSEFRQLLGAVGNEIRSNLSKIEEAVETFAAKPEDHSLLEAIPGHLAQIQGALQILGQDHVAELVTVLNQYIQDLTAEPVVPDAPVLEALAVGIGTIGAYLDGLERGSANLEGLVDRALQDLDTAFRGKTGKVSPLAAIRRLFRCPSFAGAEAAEMRGYLKELLDGANDGSGRVTELAQEVDQLLSFIEGDVNPASAEVRNTLAQSVEALARLLGLGGAEPMTGGSASPPAVPREPARVHVPAPSAATVGAATEETGAESDAPVARPDPEWEMDPEILEIFVEDARDIYGSIEGNLDAWESDPANRDALINLRRAFHTLKGSGRMVGATDIAELSWDVESQLNQVREGRLEPSPELFALLREVHRLLPSLIEALQSEAPSSADVDGLRSRIRAAAGSGGATGTGPQTLLEAEPAEPGDETRGSSSRAGVARLEGSVHVSLPVPQKLPAMDPTLLQIFSSETGSHISTLHEVAGQAGDYVSAALLRAVHTLQGSARAVGLVPMADACFELERLLLAMDSEHAPLAPETTRGVEDLASAITVIVGRLGPEAGDAPPEYAHFADLARLFHGLAADLMPAAPESPRREDAERAISVAEKAPGTPAVTSDAELVPREEPVRDPVAPPVAEAPASDLRAPAAAPPPAESEPDVDPELVEIFREEASDILEALEHGLSEWRANRDLPEVLRNLKRGLHTLKGGARMIGAMGMGDLSHVTETLLKQIEDGVRDPSDEILDQLGEVHDLLRAGVEALMTPAMPDQEMIAMARRLAGEDVPEAVPHRAAAPAAPAPAAQPARAPAAAPASAAPASAVPAPAHEAPDETQEEGDELMVPAERREYIRVRAQLLNELVNYAGEVSISRARMEQQIMGFREHLAELQRNVVRFKDQLRDLEMQAESQILFRTEQKDGSTGLDFDPLEFDRYSRLQQLSRALAESLHDLSTIHGTLDTFAGEAETVLLQQARVNTELQEGLMRTRLVGFGTQGPRLRHIVRQTARELGKRAELYITGSAVEVDKNVLDRMTGPFEHMIRNAIDHGIEDEAGRRAANKSIMGRITIHTSHEGNEIVIRFSDDGAGLKVDAIRRKAIEAGLASPERVLSDEEVMQFILLPGFSTASRVTQISGRGIGMDVVHAEIKQLGGSISVETRPGNGTTFVIRLPLTLSITQALTVMVGDQRFAIPLASIVNIVEVQADKLDAITGEDPVLHYGGRVYPLMNLGARLGLPPGAIRQRKYPVLLARAGNREIAVQVESLGTTGEIVIKSLGPQLSEIKGLAGATILGDGRVVLILDVAGLWFRDDSMSVLRLYPALEATEPEDRAPIVLIVDDSLTVRKITGKHLQKRGMKVMVAKDGVDALEQLREQKPDVMLVDVEMPRMDGFELTRTVRGNAETRDIGIIMITSRAGAKHRDHAIKLGADLYMSKPYLEDDLVANIQTLLHRQERASAG